MAGAHNIFIGTVSGVAAYVFNDTISVTTLNYNLRAAAVTAGWDQVRPLVASVTINNGVVVGSSSTSTYAFDTGVTFPVGTTLALTIGTGALVVGRGGDAPGGSGGPALRAQRAISITNNGTVGGGGGGGGRGAHYQAQVTYPIYGGSATGYGTGAGGGGGGGAGYGNAAGGATIGSTGNSTGTPTDYGAANGANSGNTTGGGGGTGGLTYVYSYSSTYYVRGGSGGNGGNLGANGGDGGGGQQGSGMTGGTTLNAATGGGAAGACTNGNANITWLVTGTRLGTLG